MLIGRSEEQDYIKQTINSEKAEILVVYGRRRIGKTFLIEETIKDRRYIKIEGVQGESERFQIDVFMSTVRARFSNPLISKVKPSNWLEAFNVLADLVADGNWIVYLEELQWLANYKPSLISQLKHAWDNRFSKIPKTSLVLCGSSPSFFITHVLKSQALYNRSSRTINLTPFSIKESQHFFHGKTLRSKFDSYLTVGGIPIYLRLLNQDPSYIKALAENSFSKNSFFALEFEKMFLSSFAQHENYKKIVAFLARRKTATRAEILKFVDKESSGLITKHLLDMEQCEFIEKVLPPGASPSSRFARYRIKDPYLHFYFNFIENKMANIQRGLYNEDPIRAIDMKAYSIWLGYAFERFCLSNPNKIAQILGFSGIDYNVGPVRSKKQTAADKTYPGFQFDLCFFRKDKVVTLCETKYLEGKVSESVIDDFEEKIRRSKIAENQNIQRVLISASAPSDSLTARHYFDRVIMLDELIG